MRRNIYIIATELFYLGQKQKNTSLRSSDWVLREIPPGGLSYIHNCHYDGLGWDIIHHYTKLGYSIHALDFWSWCNISLVKNWTQKVVLLCVKSCS